MFDEFDRDFLEDEPDDAAQEPVAGNLPPPRENPDCFGHEFIEQQLLKLISQNRLPHAMIFAGQGGTGKATMAYRLARYLLSPPPPVFREGELEGEGLLFAPPPSSNPSPPAPLPQEGGGSLSVAPDSPVFRQVASGGHPDLISIERPFDEKKDRHKDSVDIDSIRRVGPFMRMTASRDNGWRVAIIDDADTMTGQAQNAILKILEEPPKRAVLILIAHRPGALIPTIRSRCRMIPFQPLSAEIFGKLVQRIDPGLKAKDIATLFTVTGGSPGQAAGLIAEGGLEALSKLSVLLAGWPNWNWPEIHALADTLGRAGQEDGYRAFENMLRWSVESMVRTSSGASALPEILKDSRPLLENFTLPQWIDIGQTLTDHLNRTRYANLDKRQGIIGAFTVLSA